MTGSSPATKRPVLFRRQVIVEGFQTRFLVLQFAWLFAFLALFVAAIFGPLLWPLFRPEASAEQVEAATQFLTLHRTLWPAVLVLFLGLAFVYVRVSHRVAGPLYRFKKVFGEVGAGRLTTRVRLRQKDYLKEEASALDEMIQSIRARVVDAQAHLDIAIREADRAGIEPVSRAARAARQVLEGFETGEPGDSPG
jgi:methyl-accepting chemotaxis protein